MSCGSTVHMHMNMLLEVWQRPFTLPAYEQIGFLLNEMDSFARLWENYKQP